MACQKWYCIYFKPRRVNNYIQSFIIRPLHWAPFFFYLSAKVFVEIKFTLFLARQHNDDNMTTDNTCTIVKQIIFIFIVVCEQNMYNNLIVTSVFFSERTRCHRSLRVHWANGTTNTVPCWPHWDVLWEPLTSVGSPYSQYNLEVSLVDHNNRYVLRYAHNVTLQKVVCNACVSCNIAYTRLFFPFKTQTDFFENIDFFHYLRPL